MPTDGRADAAMGGGQWWWDWAKRAGAAREWRDDSDSLDLGIKFLSISHYLSWTDVTVLGQMVCKSLYTPLGMKILYRCIRNEFASRGMKIMNFGKMISCLPAQFLGVCDRHSCDK